MRSLAMLGLVLLGVSCASVKPRTDPDPRDALLGAERGLAERMAGLGARVALLAAYSPSGALLLPGQPLRTGQAEITTALAELEPPIRLEPMQAEVSIAGDAGYTLGALERGGAWAYYLAFWRNVDGTWRIEAFAQTAAQPKLERTARPLPRIRGTPAPGANLANERERILATDAAFNAMAQRQGKGAAFTAYAAEDAILVGGRRLFVGKHEVDAAFAGDDPRNLLRWTPLRAEIAQSGELGWSVGTWERQAVWQPAPTAGKYLTIWIRQPDGTWRWILDGGSAITQPVAR